MAELKNELSWSFSRDKLFKECRRAYYYYYYASWGGWSLSAGRFIRKAYILKNIKNVDMMAGDIVHRVIKWIIESRASGVKVSCSEAMARAQLFIGNCIRQSRERLWQGDVKRNANLFEHYYTQAPDDLIKQKAEDKVSLCFKNLYNSGFLEYLDTLDKKNWLLLEEMDSFLFQGVKLYAVPDFAFKDKYYYLYDWKTGRASDDNILQLNLYVLYASNKWKAPEEEIKIVPVYLLNDKVEFTTAGKMKPEEVSGYIKDSISSMKSILPENGVNETNMENCPKTDLAWRCAFCRFKELCA